MTQRYSEAYNTKRPHSDFFGFLSASVCTPEPPELHEKRKADAVHSKQADEKRRNDGPSHAGATHPDNMPLRHRAEADPHGLVSIVDGCAGAAAIACYALLAPSRSLPALLVSAVGVRQP